MVKLHFRFAGKRMSNRCYFKPVRSSTVVQHGFYARPSAHLRSLATGVGLGTIPRSSDIVRFVQGGVVKIFRCATQSNEFQPIRFASTVRRRSTAVCTALVCRLRFRHCLYWWRTRRTARCRPWIVFSGLLSFGILQRRLTQLRPGRRWHRAGPYAGRRFWNIDRPGTGWDVLLVSLTDSESFVV